MKRRLVAALLVAPLAWLGCNGLLGIDDATFVPLAEGGTGMDVPTDPAGPIGPVVPARAIVRVPAGDVRTIDVRIPSDTAAGITGIAKLAAVPSDPTITATVTQLEANHFTVSLASAATVTGFVDATVKLEASNLTESSRTSASLRALTGAPGTLDPTFGPDGGRVELLDAVESGNQESYPVGVADYTVVVGGGAPRLWVLDSDGKVPRSIELRTTAQGCGVGAIATKDSGVALGGGCGTATGFSAALDLASTQPPLVSDTPFPVRSVAVTRNGFPTILLAVGNAGLLAAVNQVPVLDASAAASVFPVENGVVTLGTAPARFAIDYVPIGADGKGGPPVVLDRLEADAAPIGVASGTSLGNETFAAVWTVEYPAPQTDEIALLYVLGIDGKLHGAKRFVAFTARVAGDTHGRIVMVRDDTVPERTTISRLLNDAGDDPSFPAAGIEGCSFPGIAVDADGMLIVSCGKPTKAVISRYWP